MVSRRVPEGRLDRGVPHPLMLTIQEDAIRARAHLLPVS